jgi:hypothetical protein
MFGIQLVKSSSLALAATLALATAASAGTVTVLGTANPFLTGYGAGGYIDFGGGDIDSVPANSPTYAGAVFGGESVTFSATGQVGNAGGPPIFPVDPGTASGPNGRFDLYGGVSAAWGATVGGYSGFGVSALVGVFYDPSAAPGAVNSSLTTLTPAVNQIFFIGDGTLGTFTAPTGATGLYLGVVDGFQWNNNSGAFTVTTNVPEPSTWAMMMLGFAGLGFAGYRKSRQPVAVAG